MLLRLLVAAVAALGLLAPPSTGRADDSLRNDFYRNLHQGGAGSAREPHSPGAATALLVTGAIGPGSYDEFRAALSRSTPAIVVIEGPGGVLGEAIMIGEEIRRRRLDTLVAPNRSCASACAVVFLSGHTRYVGTGATIGLHSASYADGRADPEATALMAAYLQAVGVPATTLARMARTAPRDIRWLTASEQRAMGIRPYGAAR